MDPTWPKGAGIRTVGIMISRSCQPKLPLRQSTVQGLHDQLDKYMYIESLQANVLATAICVTLISPSHFYEYHDHDTTLSNTPRLHRKFETYL
jgi:hypothetical protein